MEEKRGGTAGNIAYNLALMGEKPRLYGAVGKDFSEYGAALEGMGVSLAGVRRMQETFTACAYITTDRKSNQITVFHPAAMNVPCDPAFFPRPLPGDWASVSPGNTDDMRDLSRLYREKKIPYIFDPGQQVIALSAGDLEDGLSGAAILIGNEYEIEMACSRTGLTRQDILRRAGCLITTSGAAGSEIRYPGKDGPRHVPAVKTDREEEPTGAGDAYRAGLLKGLHLGLDVEASARLGAVCASFCVEKCGTQEHTFSFALFKARYESAFGDMPPAFW
jgi:adenosine kinase